MQIFNKQISFKNSMAEIIKVFLSDAHFSIQLMQQFCGL